MGDLFLTLYDYLKVSSILSFALLRCRDLCVCVCFKPMEIIYIYIITKSPSHLVNKEVKFTQGNYLELCK